MLVLWAVWLLINMVTFALYGVGAYAGMQVFRHKTKHAIFRYSVPTAAILQLILMAMLSGQMI